MDEELRAITDQHGVFLTREALACGYDDRSVRALRRAGEWRRLRQGAYCFADQWHSADAEQRHLLLADAVLRTTPGEVALSHTTSLLAHGVATWDLDLRRVHLTRLDAGAGRRLRDAVHHVGDLGAADLAVRDGVRLTTPARAVVETAMTCGLERGLVFTDNALHRGLCTIEELRALHESFGRWPGAQRLHMTLNQADGRAESPGETRLRYLCLRQHLPKPEPQVTITDGGQPFAQVDLAWPEHRVFAEFDGLVKYGRLLKEGQSVTDVVLAEKRREDRIREVTGWRCIRVIWADLADPVGTAARIRRLLHAAAA